MATSGTSDRKSSAPPAWWSRVWSKVQLPLSIAIAAAVLVWLVGGNLFQGSSPKVVPERREAPSPVRVAGPGLLELQTGTPLEKKLHPVPVTTQSLTEPLLRVTGSIVAQLRPGQAPAEDRWQFSSPELLTSYADWRKAANDLEFAKIQSEKVKGLTKARLAAQTEVVGRLRKLVDVGSDSIKDLRLEEAKLKETELQGSKDIHEADNAVRVATRNLAALERQLYQNGIDPHLMARVPDGTALVVADVPEAKISLVPEGHACAAKFYAVPGQVFTGKVGSVAPTVTKERRTLRVLFDLKDTQGALKAGMFCEVGLGTDPRQTILVPAEAVIHVARSDYVLTQGEKPGLWKVTEVQVGEPYGSQVEVVHGLRGDERVIGQAAVLLKPVVVRSLQPNDVHAPAHRAGGPP